MYTASAYISIQYIFRSDIAIILRKQDEFKPPEQPCGFRSLNKIKAKRKKWKWLNTLLNTYVAFSTGLKYIRFFCERLRGRGKAKQTVEN